MVLATSVHVEEGFLVKKYFITSSGKCLLKDFHHHHVLVDRLACFQEERTKFELVDSNFVVSGLDWYSKFEKLILNLLQNVLDLMRDLSVVVVRELLVLGGKFSDECSTGRSDVNSLQVSLSRDSKEFLLQT